MCAVVSLEKKKKTTKITMKKIKVKENFLFALFTFEFIK